MQRQNFLNSRGESLDLLKGAASTRINQVSRKCIFWFWDILRLRYIWIRGINFLPILGHLPKPYESGWCQAGFPIMVEEAICLFFFFSHLWSRVCKVAALHGIWQTLAPPGIQRGDTHKVCTDRTRSGIRHSHSFQIWPKLILRLFCGSILLGLGWLCVQKIEELFHRATLLSTLHSTSPPSAARPRRGAIF